MLENNQHVSAHFLKAKQTLILHLFLIWLYLKWPHRPGLFPQRLLESGPRSVKLRTNPEPHSDWNVHITSLILEAILLVQAKILLIFLAVRSHYWPALSFLTTLTPQASHINCNYTSLLLPAREPFGPKGRTLHLFQLNFILLNLVHHSILSKMPGALIRFSKIYAVLPQFSTHQSTHIWMPFLCQLCSQNWGFRDV